MPGIMPDVPELRPMRLEDAVAVHALSLVTFADLERRFHHPPSPPPPLEPALIRIRQLITTDPGGAWIAEEGGEVVGAALALDREGVWGLSLLVVSPAAQSQGVGRRLLERTLEYAGGGQRGAIILASPDHRALRAYARAGFTAHPCFGASGVPTVTDPPAAVREGGRDDLPLTETVSRAVRGASHGSDIEAMLRAGARMFVLPERGYSITTSSGVKLLAALDEEAARDLLLGTLAAGPEGQETNVEWITSSQQWAIEPALDAGLKLELGGGVFLRGDVGPFRPYLPNGAYL
jgi:GNAT superfamily N-acetyltransferase